MDAVAKVDELSENQYLSFILAGEEYGIDILVVQELRGWEDTTQIPNTPAYVKGVINLRGVVVPIIDLRSRFNLEEVEHGPATVVVIVKVTVASKERILGVVVDGVAEVYHINESDMQPAPEMEGAISIDFVKGLATMNDKMIILLDINRLINEGVLSSSSNVANKHGEESKEMEKVS